MERRVVGLLLSVMILSLLDGTSKASQINDITCGQAGKLTLPCLPFLQGITTIQPSASCCSGAKSVAQRASSTQNRRALCQCFKKISQTININPDRSKLLPKLCNYSILMLPMEMLI
ncbi:hypothetical protein Lal_00029813 [Lupinus albus]|nr:hypothetical protein Lal_00029813 [Lupinus albus]